MKVYDIKHCLTKGLQQVEVGWHVDQEIVGFIDSNGWDFLYGRNTEWTEDRATAVRLAREKRDREIARLRERIARLEALRFREEKE